MNSNPNSTDPDSGLIANASNLIAWRSYGIFETLMEFQDTAEARSSTLRLFIQSLLAFQEEPFVIKSYLLDDPYLSARAV